MLKRQRARIIIFALVLLLSSQSMIAYATTIVDEETGEEFTFYRDNRTEMPADFVYVQDIIPDVILDLRYHGTNNFVGTQIDGYEAPKAILTQSAAAALKRAADSLREQGYVIKIFDAYRPQAAMDHFVSWVKNEDIANKTDYYPNISKKDIIDEGYLSPRYCVHSRGSAIDLTLVDIETGEELDMGTNFDYFDKKSHHYTNLVTSEQTANRQILMNAMANAGFESLPQEWWHYKLWTDNEPYPETYFSFRIK